MAIVPLFESKESVNPEFIQKYLDALWDSFFEDAHISKEKNEEYKKKFFMKHFYEVFFAGSDTSRTMGSYAARAAVASAAKACHQWAAHKGLHMDVKFGCGESPFRQGGHLDASQGADMADEKTCADILRIFGYMPTQLSSGLALLMRKVPGVNSATLQARGHEIAQTSLTPKQQREAVKEAQNARVYSLSKKEESLSGEVHEAAHTGFESYEKILTTEASGKPGGLCSYAAAVEYTASMALPKIRDRALKRVSVELSELFADIAGKEGINTRAIAATTASGLMLPLLLIELGAVLEHLEKKDALTAKNEAVSFLLLKDTLKEMTLFSNVADEYFKLMRSVPGFESVAEDIQNRWQALWNKRGVLREAAVYEIYGEKTGDIFAQLAHGEKAAVVRSTRADIRELLADDSPTEKTALWADAWRLYAPYLEKALRTLHTQEDHEETKEELHSYRPQLALVLMANLRGYAG